MIISLRTKAGIALVVASLGLGLGCGHHHHKNKTIEVAQPAPIPENDKKTITQRTGAEVNTVTLVTEAPAPKTCGADSKCNIDNIAYIWEVTVTDDKPVSSVIEPQQTLPQAKLSNETTSALNIDNIDDIVKNNPNAKIKATCSLTINGTKEETARIGEFMAKSLQDAIKK